MSQASQELLNKVKDHRLMVSHRFVALVSKCHSNIFEKLNCDFQEEMVSIQQLLNCTCLPEVPILDVGDGFKMESLPPVPEGKKSPYHSFQELTSEERHYLRSLLVAVQYPTKYLTPSGEVVINYDCDLARYIVTKGSDSGHFYDYQNQFLDDIEKSLYLLHFPWAG